MALTKTSGGIKPGAEPAGTGSGTVGGWEPSVLWLMGLCILEVVAVAFLSRHLLK
jgi:hypothetical protein